MSDAGFSITRGSGFRITLENGWALSVQFSTHHYCDNQENIIDPPSEPLTYEEAGAKGCKDAEVAVIDPEGKLQAFSIPDGDTVKGCCTPDEVIELLRWLQYK